MRTARQSSAYLSAAALLALFCSATGASPSNVDLAECLHTRAAELARVAACGDSGSVQFCLANKLPRQAHLCSAAALEPCFLDAGCTAAEARIEAEWTVKRCSSSNQNTPDQSNMDDLRRRRPEPLAATATTSLLRRQQTTTADSTFTGATTTSLVCLTTTTISTTSCPVQSTGTGAGKETLPCFPTVASYPTCAAGLLCKTESDVTTCMVKEDISTAGIIIAIVFAVGVVLAASTMCFFCCRERRADKRHAKAAEAAAIAKQAAVEKKRPGAEVRNISSSNLSDQQPLVPPQSSQSTLAAQDPYPSSIYSQQMPSSERPSLHTSESIGDLHGPNPFADQHNLR